MEVISYLFPARGRKHKFFLDFLLKSDEVISYLFPARGRKLSSSSSALNRSSVISYLFPARGRKLFISVSNNINKKKGHFLSIPRKGTETWVLLESERLKASFPIYSPQGDGNSASDTSTSCFGCLSFPIYSPQGDGNLPTMNPSTFKAMFFVISYLFPARGRKRHHSP